MSASRQTLIAVLVAAVLLAALASTAAARKAYVTNSGAATVSVFDMVAGAAVGNPIAVGASPSDVAITPDGSRAYVTNSGSASVSVIDSATDTVIATIAVGNAPAGIAISPDGARAYVSNLDDDTVSVIDTATNSTVGEPIAVGTEPDGIAMTQAGTHALVAQHGGDVSVIDARTGAVIGAFDDNLGPSRIAIAPDATYAFVTNSASVSASIFNLHLGVQSGAPILTGSNPSGLAIAARGPVYVANYADGTVTVIDADRHVPLGPPIGGFNLPSRIAISADGSRAYVTNQGQGSVSLIDTSAAQVVGQIGVGAAPTGIAIVPDQPPRASFTVTRVKKRSQSAEFDASASTDPDSPIATYEWDFGDGAREESAEPTTSHTYAKPGAYRVTLTLVDVEGCSSSLVFRGATALCNGSALASASQEVKARDTQAPLLRLRARRRQPLGSRVVVIAQCPLERCTVELGGTLRIDVPRRDSKDRRPARRYSRRLVGTKARFERGTRVPLRLKIPGAVRRTARAALARDARATVRLRARAIDAAGNRSHRKRAIRLTIEGKERATK